MSHKSSDSIFLSKSTESVPFWASIREILIAGLLIIPIILLAVNAFFSSRPASDDYCAPGYLSADRGIFAQMLWSYNNIGGRITATVMFNLLQLFNNFENKFITGRMAALALLGLVLFISYRVSKIMNSPLLVHMILAVYILGISGGNAIIVTSTWLTTAVSYLFVILTYYFVFIMLSERFTLTRWIIGGILLSLSYETNLLLIIFASFFIFYAKRDYRVFIPIVFSSIVYLSSPGSFLKLSDYNSPLAEPSFNLFVHTFLESVLTAGYFFKANSLIFIAIFVIGMYLRVNTDKKKVLLLSLVALLYALSVIFFLRLTAIPTYTRILFLIPLGISTFLLGVYFGKSRKDADSKGVLVARLMLFICVLSSAAGISSAITQLQVRQVGWDKANDAIINAKLLGVETFAYPSFESPFAEPSSYIPARNCASRWFGIELK